MFSTSPAFPQVWDTGGQQRYRPVLSTCYRNAHGIIIVFDVTNAKSFANIPQWLLEVKEFSAAASTSDGQNATQNLPKLLIGETTTLLRFLLVSG